MSGCPVMERKAIELIRPAPPKPRGIESSDGGVKESLASIPDYIGVKSPALVTAHGLSGKSCPLSRVAPGPSEATPLPNAVMGGSVQVEAELSLREQIELRRKRRIAFRASIEAKAQALKPAPPPAKPAAPEKRVFKRLWFGVPEPLGDGPTVPTPIMIRNVVAGNLNVTDSNMCSRRRDAGAVRARHIGMWLARELTSRGYKEIGRAFGNRDHSTVLHGCRVIEEAIGNEPELAAKLQELRKFITGSQT